MALTAEQKREQRKRAAGPHPKPRGKAPRGANGAPQIWDNENGGWHDDVDTDLERNASTVPTTSATSLPPTVQLADSLPSDLEHGPAALEAANLTCPPADVASSSTASLPATIATAATSDAFSLATTDSGVSLASAAAPDALAAPHHHRKPRGNVPLAPGGAPCEWDVSDGCWRRPDGTVHVVVRNQRRHLTSEDHRAECQRIDAEVRRLLVLSEEPAPLPL